ncbi:MULTISPECIES: phage tail protein [Enterobacteriaceae]|uniref:phage tail protein n=1 Tax=Enterobacteriaceae TaxID=543 RepID=UPI00210B80EE|nr:MULTISPECIES: phage tail protein [Enterobacteriaceae]MCQ4359394.1 phage tail protein [Enterobacter kobei]MDC3552166.1 phage tail protein [Escherichia coli]UWM66662.1 phage tail protein [Enterobacter sp. CP102]HDC4314686.1 phage tail protein [Enterobacter kobei]HDC4328015.1 phage tail protein [Enterobacter kobei]
MSRTTFTWFPLFDSEKEMKPEVTRLAFNEGYEQRVTSGLNWRKSSWDLQFQGTRAEMQEIDDFLYARGGVESFNWTSPNGQKVVVVSDSHKVKSSRGYATLTTTFRQVFE